MVTDQTVMQLETCPREYGSWELVQKSSLLDRKMRRVGRQGCFLAEAQTTARGLGNQRL